MEPQLCKKHPTLCELEALLSEKQLLLSTPTQLSTPIHGITPRLGKLQPGEGFLAYAGVHIDGHDGIPQAVQQGAGFVVGEKAAPQNSSIPYIQVRNGREAWSWWESLKAGHPQDHLTILGVTGTNGKTSTVWMTRALLEASGVPCLSMGTLGAFWGQEHRSYGHTTPDPDVLFPLLATASKTGIRHVVMEVSSHSIEQKKVAPLRFFSAAFTCFSRDHLDFHLTLEAYWHAKTQLFSQLLQGRAIVHAAIASRLLGDVAPLSDLCTYGPTGAFPTPTATLLPNPIFTPEGTPLSFLYEGQRFEGHIPFLGTHNQENFLAALLLTQVCTGKISDSTLWKAVPQIPGRLEQIQRPRAPLVLVDFAHKPGALAAVLHTARTLTSQKLWVVFGCGGNRDTGKRPQMGAIARECADFVCLTSDNPRSEDPMAILREIEAGVLPSSAYVLIENRRDAIHWVLAQASEHDVVVIAGKGDETVQIYGDERRPFSDSLVVREYLQAKAAP